MKKRRCWVVSPWCDMAAFLLLAVLAYFALTSTGNDQSANPGWMWAFGLLVAWVSFPGSVRDWLFSASGKKVTADYGRAWGWADRLVRALVMVFAFSAFLFTLYVNSEDVPTVKTGEQQLLAIILVTAALWFIASAVANGWMAALRRVQKR